ncbi:hypothetical protein M427DRAFT_41486 [Gonapodya prolifera JEL478]|uniref:RRM domain-containing protein n=1 Tax=Gonapodya prolifera (strain JEL478) TaxID=1344416 RepID=A0A139AU04_GONPJ|nr:hypothetical protein M427DRAFT_41486 [Gonapodya prolifera JEL478]|eukprot:KXS20187.1 hypothetical protein M427DRAFT_41486 [Gonapodya prolifera JEL478]
MEGNIDHTDIRNDYNAASFRNCMIYDTRLLEKFLIISKIVPCFENPWAGDTWLSGSDTPNSRFTRFISAGGGFTQFFIVRKKQSFINDFSIGSRVSFGAVRLRALDERPSYFFAQAPNPPRAGFRTSLAGASPRHLLLERLLLAPNHQMCASADSAANPPTPPQSASTDRTSTEVTDLFAPIPDKLHLNGEINQLNPGTGASGREMDGTDRFVGDMDRLSDRTLSRAMTQDSGHTPSESSQSPFDKERANNTPARRQSAMLMPTESSFVAPHPMKPMHSYHQSIGRSPISPGFDRPLAAHFNTNALYSAMPASSPSPGVERVQSPPGASRSLDRTHHHVQMALPPELLAARQSSLPSFGQADMTGARLLRRHSELMPQLARKGSFPRADLDPMYDAGYLGGTQDPSFGGVLEGDPDGVHGDLYNGILQSDLIQSPDGSYPPFELPLSPTDHRPLDEYQRIRPSGSNGAIQSSAQGQGGQVRSGANYMPSSGGYGNYPSNGRAPIEGRNGSNVTPDYAHQQLLLLQRQQQQQRQLRLIHLEQQRQLQSLAMGRSVPMVEQAYSREGMDNPEWDAKSSARDHSLPRDVYSGQQLVRDSFSPPLPESGGYGYYSTGPRAAPSAEGRLSPENTCLFVANVRSTFGDETLRRTMRRVFERWGRVIKVDVVRAKGTGMPCCFVTFERAEDAALAFHDAPGTVVDGRPIRVERARSKQGEAAAAAAAAAVALGVPSNSLSRMGTWPGHGVSGSNGRFPPHELAALRTLQIQQRPQGGLLSQAVRSPDSEQHFSFDPMSEELSQMGYAPQRTDVRRRSDQTILMQQQMQNSASYASNPYAPPITPPLSSPTGSHTFDNPFDSFGRGTGTAGNQHSPFRPAPAVGISPARPQGTSAAVGRLSPRRSLDNPTADTWRTVGAAIGPNLQGTQGGSSVQPPASTNASLAMPSFAPWEAEVTRGPPTQSSTSGFESNSFGRPTQRNFQTQQNLSSYGLWSALDTGADTGQKQ